MRLKMKSLSGFIPMVVLSFFLGVPKTFCQDYLAVFTQDYGSRLSVEIDPITFLLEGYSFHLRYQPMFSERFLIGAGTYAQDLPEPFVDLNRHNRDRGWVVRVRSAYFLYGEIYADEANNGWFIGEQIGFQRFMVDNETEVRGSAYFNNLTLLTYLGYSWHPYKGSFYIKPWIGLGLTQKVDGVNTIGSTEYHVSPLTGFLTLHFGYSL